MNTQLPTTDHAAAAPAADAARADGKPLTLSQPYPGLRSFRQDEAALFFGRETQARQLRDILAVRNLVVVLGGSGSGKSSLVRAGLLPKLNSTAPIPKRSGAWYVVELRPRIDPTAELFGAIYDQIFRPLLEAAGLQELGNDRGAQPGSTGQPHDLYHIVSDALRIEPPLEHGQDVEKRCLAALRQMLFSGDEFDVGALFEFADQTVVSLDEKLSGGPRSGRANLMLMIDQFEEVFSLSPEHSEAGLNLVMSLVTSIQTFRPFNLFLVITMRSEWLHRCSEFPGVADAMNGSTYLVDLLEGRDLEKIIVQPARSELRSAGSEVGSSRTWPFAPETLRLLRNAYEDTSHIGNAPDQLPLLQHLLPLLWNHAVPRQVGVSAGARISIDPRHLTELPGWSPDRPLAACLNADADGVMANAISAMRAASPSLGDDDAKGLLRVAFSSLALLDSHGIVRRRFATLDQILSDSGLVARNQSRRPEIATALKAGLAEFRRATLIDWRTNSAGTVIEINHEALARNWQTYAAWIKRARDICDRLIELARKAAVRDSPSTKGGKAIDLAAIQERLLDFLSAASLRAAAESIGSEAGEALTHDVFGDRAAFSLGWARRALKEEREESPLEEIKKTVRDADRYRNIFWNRYRTLTVMLALSTFVFFIVFTILGLFARSLYEQAHLIGNMGALGTLQSIVTRGDTDQLTADQELAESYAAFMISRKKGDDRDFYVSRDIRNAMTEVLVRSDRNLRFQLARAVWLRTGSMSGAADNLAGEPALCIDPGKTPMMIPRRGVKWVSLQEDKGPWVLSWIDPDEKRQLRTNLPRVGEDWPAGSVICTSQDGNWQLIWKSAGANTNPPSQPGIRHIEWNPLATGWSTDRPSLESKIHVSVEDAPRHFFDRRSADSYYPGPPNLFAHFREISSRVSSESGNESSVVSLVKDGHWVGFRILLAGGASTTLWTVAGVWEPEEVQDSDVRGALSACIPTDAAQDAPGCGIGDAQFSRTDYHLRVNWKPLQEDGGNCIKSACRVSIVIETNASHVPQAVSLLKIDKPYSTMITAGVVKDGYLWLKDGSGKAWRYLVDVQKLEQLHASAWKDVERIINWSTYCKGLRCWEALPAPYDGWKPPLPQ
jgi:hypothetical protein